MHPVLRDGNYVLINRLAYILSSPKIADLIAARDPRDGKTLIKRITKINNGLYFVEGDNKKASTDSRNFGWLRRKNIIGKVIYVL